MCVWPFAPLSSSHFTSPRLHTAPLFSAKSWTLRAPSNATLVSIADNPLHGALLEGVVGMHHPGVLNLTNTHLRCPLPDFPRDVVVESSSPLPCDLDMTLLKIETAAASGLLVLVAVLLLCVWRGHITIPRPAIEKECRKKVTFVCGTVLKLLGLVSRITFLVMAVASVRVGQALIACDLLDNRALFGPQLPWTFLNSTGGVVPDPSLAGLCFADYMDAVVAGTGRTATSPSVLEEADGFRAWCATIAQCKALPKRGAFGDWWTCGSSGEAVHLPIFGTWENVLYVILLYVAMALFKEVVKVCCLLYARTCRGDGMVPPALVHFAASSYFVPCFLGCGKDGQALVGALVQHDATGCQLLCELLLEGVGDNLLYLLLNLYIYTYILRTSVNAVATATIPITVINLLFTVLKTAWAFLSRSERARACCVGARECVRACCVGARERVRACCVGARACCVRARACVCACLEGVVACVCMCVCVRRRGGGPSDDATTSLGVPLLDSAA